MVKLREQARRTLGPDQLGTYIKVSRPSVWMLIAVMVALLVAGTAWFFAGTVNESVSGPSVAGGSSCIVYVPLSRSSEVKLGDTVTLAGNEAQVEGTVTALSSSPVSLEQIEGACGTSNLPGFSQDTLGIAVTVDASPEPGTYTARIITASHRPIRLLLGLD